MATSTPSLPNTGVTEDCAVSPDQKDECSVCKDEFGQELTVLLSCGHYFHDRCGQRWFSSSSNLPCRCPLCRAQFKIAHYFDGDGLKCSESDDWKRLKEETEARNYLDPLQELRHIFEFMPSIFFSSFPLGFSLLSGEGDSSALILSFTMPNMRMPQRRSQSPLRRSELRSLLPNPPPITQTLLGMTRHRERLLSAVIPEIVPVSAAVVPEDVRPTRRPKRTYESSEVPGSGDVEAEADIAPDESINNRRVSRSRGAH